MHTDFTPPAPARSRRKPDHLVSAGGSTTRSGRGVKAPHRAYLALATAALAAGMLVSLAGCQTPPQPTYNGMVPPPATGAAGQPAPYGPVGAPQVSYAQTPGPMPGPASSWQGAAPATQPPPGYPAPPPAYAGAPPQQPPAGSQPPAAGQQSSNWNWSQSQPPAQPAAQQAAPPITPSSPPAAVQQAPPTGYPPPTYNGQQPYNAAPANGYQQPPAGQPQPWTGQYQPPAQQAPPQQAAAGNWWPFSDPTAIPPARATPTAVPRY